ncbi:MAG: PQQ-dependent sugar dehydrogenase, partial [Ilumatobacteraceae bacterium]
VDLAWRDGDDGVYVVEAAGRIVRVADESQRTVLDITDLTEAGGERGLLGLAFDPSGELAYVNYTDNAGTTTISEYPVDADGTFRDGDEARVVMTVEQPYPNHNGGDLTFGPDGMLYIGTGDGGDGGDPQRRATDMTTLLGKMLRIDPAPADGQPYTVPADNPFVGDDDAAPEIWSSGLRNPWRFSFDRETGDLWIADVGQNAIEEIDVAPATAGVDAGKGLSFGWSAFEGDERYNDDVPDTGHTPPFSTYGHEDGRCSISGGVRARGGDVPELLGWYVYADYCSGEVWALEVTGEGGSLASGRQVLLGEIPSATAAVDGPDGAVYVLSAAGPVTRLEPIP